jgi:hypothetical protein
MPLMLPLELMAKRRAMRGSGVRIVPIRRRRKLWRWKTGMHLKSRVLPTRVTSPLLLFSDPSHPPPSMSTSVSHALLQDMHKRNPSLHDPKKSLAKIALFGSKYPPAEQDNSPLK